MKTLDDAWRWYLKTVRQVRLVRRLAELHWSELPWDGKLGRDDQLRDLDPEKLADDANFNLSQIDDLAVLVLFAVFEAMVRDHLVMEIGTEVQTKGISHALLLRSFEDLIRQAGEGIFFRILEPYKAVDPNLVEQVNQVRRYRNWVAHGRHGTRPESVDPPMAYDRLSRLLPRRERSSYEPEAPASEFRRGPAIHSLALRAGMIHFLAGVIWNLLNPPPQEAGSAPGLESG